MNFIFSTLIVILIILLFSIFAAWLDKFGQKHKGEFIDKAIEKVLGKVSTIVTSGIAVEKDQLKTCPWYLVVYTKESNIPMWISHNNIRSVHPDLKNGKITVKLFQGEDMVIDNVENYELMSANDMCDYDM